ncbi:MAG: hypothetical protein PHS48_02665 [Bacteroidales bacterium]|nr:hypothetical protein [Bacteroidales bacterium]
MYLYAITFFVGCISALAELLSRYSRIGQIFKFISSWVYLTINGSAAALAFWFISENNLNFGAITETEVGRIILAGTSSMVILRSSFASIRNGNKNFEAGLASITNVFLRNADRVLDRKRSIEDFKEIQEIMEKINFNKAKIDLPLLCLSTMKNVTLEEQQILANDIIKLSQDAKNDKTKSTNLGVLISNITGIDLLKEVVSKNMEIFTEASDNKYTNTYKINELLNKFK